MIQLVVSPLSVALDVLSSIGSTANRNRAFNCGRRATKLANLIFALILLSGLSVVTLSEEVNAFELEYRSLYETTEDKEALEAIRSLHAQLDDDNDGTIEPSETGDFIRDDLQYGSDRRREKSFHSHDVEITVKDLWTAWKHSEVYNWTTDQVNEWLEKHVELPQYVNKFAAHDVNGTSLPKLLASGSNFLPKVLGITNPIHRSKISLKAMDVVLFGPPRDTNNFLKDAVLTSLLVVALSGCLYAYRQNKKSQDHINRMMRDMDGLAMAEQSLIDLQEKLQQKDSKIESLSSTPSDLPDAIEWSRLKEEVEILRNELQRAEVELEDKCWVAPPVLQHWLQLTYELESQTYNAKRKAAEDQLETAKEMCQRLKMKRTSLVGAFVSTHGRSIDDVDRSILEAKTALMEVTKDLAERSTRWRQVEILCGCSIVNNPGIPVLQSLIRHVGAGRGRSALPMSRMSNSVSQDDLALDDDAHSVAASQMSSMSKVGGPAPSLLSSALHTSAASRRRNKQELKLSREPSKESSSSDEIAVHHGDHRYRSATPPAPQSRHTSSPLTAKRNKMMVKSLSQDAGGSISAAKALAANAVVSNSSSETHLISAPPAIVTSQSTASMSSMSHSIGRESSTTSIVEDCSGSESGSLLNVDGKLKKKKRSFLSNFRKKKEKKDII